MTALNFPSSPVTGQTYEYATWDGEKWYLTNGGIGASFTPMNLAGLIGWWDTSVLASMTFSGSTVLTMADQSGAGNHLGQYGAVARPTYHVDGFNNRSSIEFNAVTAQALGTAGTSFAIGTGNTLTFWFVGTMSGNTSSAARVVSYNSTGNDHDNTGSFCLNRANTAYEIALTRAGAETTHATINLDRHYRVIVTVAPSGAVTIYVNGVSAATGTLSGNWTSPGVFRLGSGNAGNYWAGRIAEAGIATSFNTPTTVASLDAYLASKWGYAPVVTGNPVTDFLARAGTMDGTHTTACTNLINGLVTDGVWSKFDVLYLLASQTSGHALLNLVANQYNASAFGVPAFVADRGFTGVDGSGSVYISTSFTPNIAVSPKYTQNSAHMSCWSNTNNTTQRMGMGADNISKTGMHIRFTDGSTYFYINGPSSTPGGATSNSLGHFLGNRSGSAAWQGYQNGTQITGSTTDTSGGVSSIPMMGLAYASGAAAALGDARQLSALSWGSSLTSGEVTAFYNRLRTYMTAVGVP